MRWLFALPLLAFAALVGYFAAGLGRDPQELPSALLNRPAPDFALPALLPDKPGLARADLVGAPMLVNVWASWCGPCRVEHPHLMALAEAGVPLAGINYKDRTADARRFLAQLGDPFQRIGVDADGRAAIDWGVYGVPETYVVDAGGVIRHRHVGPLTAEAVERTLKPLLKALAK